METLELTIVAAQKDWDNPKPVSNTMEVFDNRKTYLPPQPLIYKRAKNIFRPKYLHQLPVNIINRVLEYHPMIETMIVDCNTNPEFALYFYEEGCLLRFTWESDYVWFSRSKFNGIKLLLLDQFAMYGYCSSLSGEGMLYKGDLLSWLPRIDPQLGFRFKTQNVRDNVINIIAAAAVNFSAKKYYKIFEQIHYIYDQDKYKDLVVSRFMMDIQLSLKVSCLRNNKALIYHVKSQIPTYDVEMFINALDWIAVNRTDDYNELVADWTDYYLQNRRKNLSTVDYATHMFNRKFWLAATHYFDLHYPFIIDTYLEEISN